MMTERVLVAYSATSTHVSTTLEYLLSIKKYTNFAVDFVHVTHDASMDFDFDDYDVVFHNYCARLCFEGYVSQSYQDKLKAFKGVKILAVQDEYDRTDALKAAILRLGFDIVLTCVPQDSLDYVYPEAAFGHIDFLTVFTGYVPDDFETNAPPPLPLKDRPILIGYRGRDIGGRYGSLGFEKFEIGRRMKELCDARGIATDIAMDEANRIYGDAWLVFMGNCRAMLGSESGSNVFDFDGTIEARFKEMTAANHGVAPSYQAFLPVVAQRDREIDMGQISPRVFECALMRTPMILFRGRYSDAILPDEHYIALEKDFSNFDAVIARLDDLEALDAMTARTFAHLVRSGQFGYRTFFARVEAAIRARLAQKPATGRQGAPAGAGAAAMAADGPSFSVRRWSVLERATARPEMAADFADRMAVQSIALYERENRRLAKELANVTAIYSGELARLKNVYQDERQRLSAYGDPIGTAIAALPAEIDVCATQTSLDRECRAQQAYEDQLAEATAAIESGDLANKAAFAARLTGIKELTLGRYEHLAAYFKTVAALYQTDADAYQQAISGLSRTFREAMETAASAQRSVTAKALWKLKLSVLRIGLNQPARLAKRLTARAVFGLWNRLGAPGQARILAALNRRPALLRILRRLRLP